MWLLRWQRTSEQATTMIDIYINKIDMYDNDEFNIQFRTKCGKCNVEVAQEINGGKMTRLVVTCTTCQNTHVVNIIDSIRHTIEKEWNYSPDDVETVMEKLRNFEKED